MNHDDCELRAVIATTDDGIEAQLIEIDIAARAPNIRELIKELEHAMIVTYEIARDLNETPFVGVLRTGAPHLHHADRQHEQKWDIDLPAPVAEALAAALHARKPVRSISAYGQAA